MDNNDDWRKTTKEKIHNLVDERGNHHVNANEVMEEGTGLHSKQRIKSTYISE